MDLQAKGRTPGGVRYGDEPPFFGGRVAEALDKLWNAAEPPEPSRMDELSPETLSALAFIHARFADKIALDDMAAAAGLSRFHFVRRFKDETGYTPYKYLVLFRVKNAQRLLLARPNMRIHEIGSAVGYEDPTAFARLFKQHAGAPPQRFREQEMQRALGEESA